MMKLASPCTLAPPLLRPRCTAALPAQLGRCKHSACTPARATSADAACTTASCIQGSGYAVSAEDCALFHSQGRQRALRSQREQVYDAFLARKIEVPGKDLCDMSGAKGRTPDDYSVYNVMLPRTYYPAWQGNVFEQRCQAIADQLQGGDMAVDYDQILAKRPQRDDAVFAWHQDMAYWPPWTAATATATCWLAVSAATAANGCMRFVPGSHRERALRPHAPVGASREESHALVTQLLPDDDVALVPIARGDVTVHSERVVHGSGPNRSPGWRRAYVLAFRKAACVAEERAHGFTHSHNDEFNWDRFHQHSAAVNAAANGR